MPRTRFLRRRHGRLSFAPAAGSIDRVADCLVTNPFKLTEIDLLLGGRPAACFITESRPDLKEGKPDKRLQSADKRFIKARASGGSC